MARLVERLGLSRYDADEHYKLALAAYQKRQIDEAILQMEQAIKLLPNNSEYFAARGFFYLEDGIENKAQADFEQALKIYRLEMLANYGLGMIAYKAKKWKEAQAYFMNAFKVDPERPETLYYLALSYHHDGNNLYAVDYMQRAQAAFEKIKDNKRRTSAEKWVKRLQPLAATQNQLPEAT